jgi:beta-phosphoglucomutase-like phosphatase (HAD superfamily)
MQFNHVANRLAAAHFDTIVDLFTNLLGFAVLRRTERSIWLRQGSAHIDLQFSRSDTASRDADKLRSQVAFLSETPREDLDALAEWLRARGLAAAVGAYSDREFYLDAPAVFVDFVIEAMRPELADYPLPD